MFLFPLLLGCTWELVNEPCDTGTINLEVDALWKTIDDNWQQPAVGTDFVCGLQRADVDLNAPALPSEILCFGDSIDGLPPSAPVQPTTEVSKLSAGGGMLCSFEETGRFECWGPGALDAARSLTDSVEGLAATEGEAAVVRIAPGDDHLCALISVPLDTKPRCYGESVVAESRPPDPEDPTANIVYTEVVTSATMACGRATTTGSPVNPPEFLCWGDTPAGLTSDIDRSTCWAAFDVTAGVLCAVTGPGNADDCDRLPWMQCWGDSEDPIVKWQPDLTGRTTSDGSAVGPSSIELGADFGCVSYGAEGDQGSDSLVCWGEPGGAWEAYPRGANLTGLSIAPEGRHACALEIPAGQEPTQPPTPPTGALTCWGELPEGIRSAE